METTEGFEAHADELREIALAWKAEWAAQREKQCARKAEALGVPGNLKLGEYVLSLEYRLQKLEEQMARLP